VGDASLAIAATHRVDRPPGKSAQEDGLRVSRFVPPTVTDEKSGNRERNDERQPNHQCHPPELCGDPMQVRIA
jgi:hypothetical protein